GTVGPKVSFSASTKSPGNNVFSMDPEGMWYAWTSVARMTSAIATGMPNAEVARRRRCTGFCKDSPSRWEPRSKALVRERGDLANPGLYGWEGARVPPGRPPVTGATWVRGASVRVHTRPETCSAGILGGRHDSRFRTRCLHRCPAAGSRLPVPQSAGGRARSPRHAHRLDPQIRRVPHRRCAHRRREQDAARNPRHLGRPWHHG